MRKTLNGKSSRCDVSKERNCHRLRAVLSGSVCEVHPGVDPASEKCGMKGQTEYRVAGYVRRALGVRKRRGLFCPE